MELLFYFDLHVWIPGDARNANRSKQILTFFLLNCFRQYQALRLQSELATVFACSNFFITRPQQALLDTVCSPVL